MAIFFARRGGASAPMRDLPFTEREATRIAGGPMPGGCDAAMRHLEKLGWVGARMAQHPSPHQVELQRFAKTAQDAAAQHERVARNWAVGYLWRVVLEGPGRAGIMTCGVGALGAARLCASDASRLAKAAGSAGLLTLGLAAGLGVALGTAYVLHRRDPSAPWILRCERSSAAAAAKALHDRVHNPDETDTVVQFMSLLHVLFVRFNRQPDGTYNVDILNAGKGSVSATMTWAHTMAWHHQDENTRFFEQIGQGKGPSCIRIANVAANALDLPTLAALQTRGERNGRRFESGTSQEQCTRELTWLYETWAPGLGTPTPQTVMQKYQMVGNCCYKSAMAVARNSLSDAAFRDLKEGLLTTVMAQGWGANLQKALQDKLVRSQTKRKRPGYPIAALQSIYQ